MRERCEKARGLPLWSEPFKLGSRGNGVGGYTRPFAKWTAQALMPSIARILNDKISNQINKIRQDKQKQEQEGGRMVHTLCWGALNWRTR